MQSSPFEESKSTGTHESSKEEFAPLFSKEIPHIGKIPMSKYL